VRGQKGTDGLHFPELDLTIPAAFIVGASAEQRYIGPGGLAFTAVFPNRADFPIAAIDKSALLRLLAEEAAVAGTNLR